jgi:radical SAM protein
MNFDQSPLLAVWEVTQACDLCCINCRSSIQSECNPGELSTKEGFELLEEIRCFGNPLVVLSGGDPLKRPDLFDLISYSTSIGLRTNVTLSATPLLTADVIDRFHQLGVARLALSIDGPDAVSHDAFRGIPGTFDRAVAALGHARQLGLATQVHTTVTRRNKALLGGIAERVFESSAKLWSLFFPATAGGADELSAADYEHIFDTLYELSKLAPFEIKTTEGMHYRRYVAQQQLREHSGQGRFWRARTAFRAPGVGDGRGFVFVSHTGEIYPSGYLPVSGGNVRRDSLVDVYRNCAIFRQLRDPSLGHGKCGPCEYNKVCGGSRARAYAFTGDLLAEDPRCLYQPARP